MFRLHETTRKRLCRRAFVVLCVAPTLATTVWMAHWHRPSRLLGASRSLSSLLRVDVRLSNWEQPRPAVYRAASVALGDGGALATLIEAHGFETLRRGAARSIAVDSCTIEAARLTDLAALVPVWLTVLEERSAIVLCEGLTIVGPLSDERANFEFAGARFVVSRDDAAAGRAEINGRLSTPSDDEVTIRAAFDRRQDGGLTAARIEIDARGATLPAWLAPAGLPVAGSFGTDATFSGSVQLEALATSVRGSAAGVLSNVALSSFLAARSMGATGQGTVTIDELSWRGERIERLSGRLHAKNVQLSRTAILAAAERLACATPSVDGSVEYARDPHQMVPVDVLACRFELTSEGLTIWGEAGAERGIEGCLALSGGIPVLMHPKFENLPAGAWVQFVTGLSTSWLPASQEAVELASRLPLPAARAGIVPAKK